MGRIFTIPGIFLILALSWNTNAFAIVQTQHKRSIDLDDLYQSSNTQQHRLPKDVVATSYHLELEPEISAGTFKGRVRINVTWTDTSDMIILNASPQLNITSCDVKLTDLSPEEKERGVPMLGVDIARTERHRSRTSWYTISLQQMLKAGSKCQVDLTFFGNLTTNETIGFFRSEYTDSNRQIHQFVAASLRMNYAQQMFPCMDQPQFKANFKLSVLRPKNMTAMFNMPLEKSTEADGHPDMMWDHFQESPKMSTYQVSLIVSDLESISPTEEVNEINGNKVEIKVWGRKEYLESLEGVPNKVVKILNYLQTYFNSSIGVPKLDVMAVPTYNAPKASDSWGLMFFKESELSNPSVWNTAYELVYQWIGQYITPFSWSAAPANKALNSFLASMTTVDINPDEMDGKWPMTMLYSLYYEFGKTVPFSRVAGIRNDATLAKMELIFRMFNYTLGRELFRKSVNNFIQQESEENLRTFFAEDIYTRLDEVAKEADSLPPGLTINNIAGPWINRIRIPLVTAIRDYETKTITLSQKVYLREPPPPSTSKVAYQWDIPIVMVTQENLQFSESKPTTWLTKSDEPRNLTITDPASEESFIIINPEEIGIFPVNYDTCNWKKIATFLQSQDREKIPVLTRAKLLHDSWNLAYASEQDFKTALNMTLFLKQERSHVVWQPVFTMIDHIGRRIEGSDVYPKFEAYILSLLKPLYQALCECAQGDEPSWKVHILLLANNFLCRAGYEPCIKEAREQYKKWLTDEEPDKGNPVANEFICPVFKWGTEEEWEFGLQRVINFPQSNPERKQNERTYLLKTLAGCPKDPYKIERLLNVTILNQNGNFTDSDIRLIFSMLTSGATGYTTLFNFLAKHWDTIKQRFENKSHLWNGIINSASSSFSTQEGLEMVEELYANHRGEFESAESIIQEALKIIKQEAAWSEKNLPVIDEWLNENLSKEQLEALEKHDHTDETPAAG